MTGSARIDPARRFEAACAIAGVLAEAGLTRMEIRRGNRVQAAEARVTDLPELLAAGDVELTSPGFRVRISGTVVEWDVDDEAVAEALCAAIG